MKRSHIFHRLQTSVGSSGGENRILLWLCALISCVVARTFYTANVRIQMSHRIVANASDHMRTALLYKKTHGYVGRSSWTGRHTHEGRHATNKHAASPSSEFTDWRAWKSQWD